MKLRRACIRSEQHPERCKCIRFVLLIKNSTWKLFIFFTWTVLVQLIKQLLLIDNTFWCWIPSALMKSDKNITKKKCATNALNKYESLHHCCSVESLWIYIWTERAKNLPGNERTICIHKHVLVMFAFVPFRAFLFFILWYNTNCVYCFLLWLFLIVRHETTVLYVHFVLYASYWIVECFRFVFVNRGVVMAKKLNKILTTKSKLKRCLFSIPFCRFLPSDPHNPCMNATY